MKRDESIQRIRDRERPWDVLVIGGGATGVGIALDAASRGLDVLLLERFDFGKGTSSRSTKLVHGGVRYLAQGNITLVRDALRERGLLMQNAPHLVSPMSFVIPCRSWWRWLFYGLGLKVYDLLARGDQFSRSKLVSAKRAVELVPTLTPKGLRGGVAYQDGQFDDAALLLAMARTASRHGACLANYMNVIALKKDDEGQVLGVEVTDNETDEVIPILARQ
ncbi:MAG: FAD-dependent oxidoreductase, partial [Planctomycetota bacterium]